MVLSLIQFGKVAQSEDVNPIVRLLSGTSGTTHPVQLIQQDSATVPALTVRNKNTTNGAPSFEIKNSDSSVSVMKAYYSTSTGESVLFGPNVRVGMGGVGVNNNGVLFVNESTSAAGRVMADFVLDHTGNTNPSDSGAGRFVVRQLSGGAASYIRALEAHSLKGSGTTVYPVMGIECTVESTVAGDGDSKLVGISIRNSPYIWGVDPTYGSAVACDTALRIGNDDGPGWTNYISCLGNTADGNENTVLFKIVKDGTVHARHIVPRATTSYDLGLSGTPWRVVYASLNYADNGAVGAPSYTFNSDPDTGFYRTTTNALGVTTAGTLRETWDADGNIIFGAGAIATNATNGFVHMITCAGAPSGTPGTVTGRLPMVYDSSNNKLYVYNGAWKGVTLS